MRWVRRWDGWDVWDVGDNPRYIRALLTPQHVLLLRVLLPQSSQKVFILTFWLGIIPMSSALLTDQNMDFFFSASAILFNKWVLRTAGFSIFDQVTLLSYSTPCSTCLRPYHSRFDIAFRCQSK